MRKVVAVFGLVLLMLAGLPPGRAAADELRTEEVTAQNGSFTVRGTVIAPAGPGTGRPGIVLVPGAGENVPREYYRPHAEAFARAGIVTLIYDKRGAAEGYSLFAASLPDLADDAIAAVGLLRGRPDVNPDLVGVHGHSEGGWTVVEAARRSPDIGFVIAMGASGLPPEQTQIWMNQTYLRDAGVTESLLAPLGANLTRQIVATRQFRLAGYDPVPDLERLEQPLLGVFAEYDRSSSPGESFEIYRRALERSGHDRYSLRVVPGANHQMEPSSDGFDREQTEGSRTHGFAPGYVETVTDWVNGLASGSPDWTVDRAPAQSHSSSRLAPVAPYESFEAQVVVFGLLILAFLSYPVIAVVNRLRGRRDPGPIRWPARVVATLGLLLPVVTIGFLGSIMIDAGRQPGPVILGRPLLWLGLQLAALIAAVAVIVLLVRLWHERDRLPARTTVRLGIVSVGGVLLACWSAYWGLFTV